VLCISQKKIPRSDAGRSKSLPAWLAGVCEDSVMFDQIAEASEWEDHFAVRFASSVWGTCCGPSFFVPVSPLMNGFNPRSADLSVRYGQWLPMFVWPRSTLFFFFFRYLITRAISISKMLPCGPLIRSGRVGRLYLLRICVSHLAVAPLDDVWCWSR